MPCRLYARLLVGMSTFVRSKLAPDLPSTGWLFPCRSLADYAWLFETFGERWLRSGGADMGAWRLSRTTRGAVWWL